MKTLIKKEIRDLIFSRKGLYVFLAVSLLLSAMAFSYISVKELSFLAQVEIVMTQVKILLGVSLLITIVVGATLFATEAEQGTLESLLLTPISNRQLLFSKFTAIAAFWLVLLVLSIPYFYVLTSGTTLFGPTVLFLFIIGTAVVCSFAALSLCLSALLSSGIFATMLGLVLFLISAMPEFLSTTTKKVGFAHLIDTLSPLSSSLKALKDLLVNKMSWGTVLTDALPALLLLVLAVIALIGSSRKIRLNGGDAR